MINKWCRKKIIYKKNPDCSTVYEDDPENPGKKIKAVDETIPKSWRLGYTLDLNEDCHAKVSEECPKFSSIPILDSQPV